MKTVLIDILNEKAIKLLKELEELKLIKFLDGDTPADNSKLPRKASDYKGIISPELSEELQEHIRQSRNQWQNRI
jgi:hypothetical protein